MIMHPKYGLNPSMEICFFCGRETGQIVCHGASWREEAPRKLVMTITPCAKCKEEIHGKFVFIVCDGEGKAYGSRWVKIPVDALDPHMNGEIKKKLVESCLGLMEEAEFRRLFQEKGS